MMKAITALVFLLTAGASADPVTGRVLDASGAPAPGVHVAPMWQWENGRPVPTEGAVTDGSGSFSWEPPYTMPKMPLVAYSESGSLSGFAFSTGDPVTITLATSVHVTATVTSTDLGGAIGPVTAYWQHGDAFPIMSPITDGRLDVRLPAIAFDAWIFGGQVKSPDPAPSIDGTRIAVDLGTIDLPGTFIAMNVGLPAPKWTVSDARNMKIDAAQIADLKGRWVLVDFWGFW